jgi:hypothetical protein
VGVSEGGYSSEGNRISAAPNPLLFGPIQTGTAAAAATPTSLSARRVTAARRLAPTPAVVVGREAEAHREATG